MILNWSGCPTPPGTMELLASALGAATFALFLVGGAWALVEMANIVED